MSTDLSMTEQRDRFVAFAFAASDVLMEVDSDGEIVFAAGSVKTLLGRDPATLNGTPLSRLATPDDTAILKEFLRKLVSTGRCSDQLVNIDAGKGTIHQVSISGMSSPQRSGIHHLAVKRVPLAARRAQGQVPASPMSVMDFANSAAMLAGEAQRAGENVNFTMYDVGWDEVERKIGKKEAEQLNDAMVQTLRAWASGGSGVGQVGRGKYSLLLDEGVSAEKLSDRMSEVAKEASADLDLTVRSASLDISDVIDTDSFEEMFEQAMNRFDEVGGEKFDLLTFNELPAATKKAAQGKPAPLSSQKTARQMARRRGVTESWG